MAALTVSEISRLVDGFYVKVREDAKIGPLFTASIKDWPRHLTLLKNFWSSVLLTTGTYQGDPMAIHVHHSNIAAETNSNWSGELKHDALSQI